MGMADGIGKRGYFRLLGYRPHVGQERVHCDGSRFRVVVAGRRWGKSTMAGHEASYEFLKPGRVVWVVSRTYDLGEKVFRVAYDDIVRVLGMGVGGSYSVRSGKMRMEGRWGSILEVRSADHKDSLVGERIDFLVFDECALCDDDVWDKYLRASLVTGGGGIFIGTPRGMNWFYDLVVGMGGEEGWGIHRGVSMENEYIDIGEFERVRREVREEVYREEYLAEFVEGGGLVYDVRGVVGEVVGVYDRFWIGIDVGYENPFVALYIGEVGGRYEVYDELYMRRAGIVEIMGELDRRGSIYAEGVYCDPSARWFIGELERSGYRVGVVRRGVREGIEEVRRQMEMGRLVVGDRCRNLVGELGRYRYGRGDEVVKEDDHGPDALRYAVMGILGDSGDIYLPGGMRNVEER